MGAIQINIRVLVVVVAGRGCGELLHKPCGECSERATQKDGWVGGPSFDRACFASITVLATSLDQFLTLRTVTINVVDKIVSKKLLPSSNFSYVYCS